MYNAVRRKNKLSDLIFDQIKNSILDNSVKPGEKLPSERELVDQFEASRIAVREGMKSLEAAGFIKIKPGKGMFVEEVNSKTMSDALFAFLRIRGTPISELTEARVLFEPTVTKLACEKMTEQDFGKLEENIREASEVLRSSKLATIQNIEFHSIIAESTHNTVIALTMKTFFDVLKEITLEVSGDFNERFKTSQRAVTNHKRILEALRNRDSEKAYELSLSHVLMVQKVLRKHST
jgi:GntR family transcriptional repressor for pyruvate dehydrogenase complex